MANKVPTFVKSKRTLFVFFLICFMLLYTLNNTSIWRPVSEMKDSHDRSGLLLDTPGCKVQRLDPYDETLKHIIETKKPYVCKGDPTFMITMPNSTIILNETILKIHYNVSKENLSCCYNAILRVKPTKKSARENDYKFGKMKPLKFGVPLGEEFVKVQCKFPFKNYTHFIPLVPIKPDVEKRALKAQTDNRDLLNVILIGIDSVSQLNFIRHFKKTRKYLTSTVSSFDMKGFTKVADNTFPNLTPLLTGHFVEHYWNESLRTKMFFDNLDFIWKTYSKYGYRTFYAEDYPQFGTYQYMKKGFQNPPTDYYYRPMALAVKGSGMMKKGSYCLNDQIETNMIYNYLKDYVNSMQDKRYFAFVMVSTLTHNYINDASYADEPTFKLLEYLWSSGAMNRSITIIFSDHGIRFGSIRETYIGKFEERMPFMRIVLPEWFLQKYKNISRNLKINQNRLITVFDVHATLFHMLNFTEPISDDPRFKVTPNGLSLLNEISEYRTCEMANIMPHWCPCQVYQAMAPNDKNVTRATVALIDSINNLLKPYIIENICAKLEIDKLTDARLGRANDMVLRFVQHKNDVINRSVMYGDRGNPLNDYLLTIRTRPGGGMFEGTVRHDTKRDLFKVLGISRINMYGKQSRCIESQIMKKFCYCP